jgi:hypothetical protein
MCRGIHLTLRIKSFSSNLQLDNGLVGSRLLILSVPQVDVPSGLVYCEGKKNSVSTA